MRFLQLPLGVFCRLPPLGFSTALTSVRRYTPHPHGHVAALKLSDQYAFSARNAIDVDEPSVDALQALLLLVLAFTAAGKGKKAFMAMCT